MPNKVYLTKRFSFEAAHHLVGYDGACSNIHGHSYKLEVTVSGAIDVLSNQSIASNCMVIDFKSLKEIVKKHIISTHDHADLNTLYDNPTAENMVISMFDTIEENLPCDVKLENVKLWETEDSYAEYRGECYGLNTLS